MGNGATRATTQCTWKREVLTLGGSSPSGAAVLCPIIHADGRDQLLLGLRPQTSSVHAGQFALPGGKAESDEQPVDTALRECFEEVGLPRSHAAPLGELPPRVSTSRFHVHCVVARVAPFPIRRSPREVERVLFVPLDELRDPERWRELPPPTPHTGDQPRTSPHFEHDGDLIWGLTGRFLRDLVGRLARPS